MRAWLLPVLVTVVVTAIAPRRAHADDRQAARDAFAAGQDADKRKDYQAAIQFYLKAYELAPHPNALYNAAVDYERIGDLREAATFYGRYLDEAGETEDRAKVTRLIDNLRKRPSRISIRTTPPGGAITIDDAPVGQAPVTRDIAGGAHVIAATQGDRRSQRQITVEYGEPAEVVLALADQQGTLSVTSNVSGAAVEIDGAPVGTTPLTVAVSAGDRKVVVHSDGYSTLERMVRVPAEGSAQITATLIRPLGYVEPTNPTKTYVFAIDGGPVIKADTNMLHVAFGYRILGWEVCGRLGFYGNSTVGYGLLIRRYLGDGRLKPYLGAIAEYGNNSSTSETVALIGGHGGLALELMSAPKFVVELTVDGGAALFSGDGDKQLAFPVSAAVQFHGR